MEPRTNVPLGQKKRSFLAAGDFLAGISPTHLDQFARLFEEEACRSATGRRPRRSLARSFGRICKSDCGAADVHRSMSGPKVVQRVQQFRGFVLMIVVAPHGHGSFLTARME